MFGIALDVRVADLRSVFAQPRAPLVGLASQFLVLPPVTFALTRILDPAPSIVFFVGFVTVAFLSNIEHFAALLGAVALAVFLHNALALALGYGAAAALGLEERDRRAVSIEVGIQNSALALVLIFGLFGGLGGMALVAAWWGIWHLISGLALATVWSRRPPPAIPAGPVVAR